MSRLATASKERDHAQLPVLARRARKNVGTDYSGCAVSTVRANNRYGAVPQMAALPTVRWANHRRPFKWPGFH